MRVDQRIKGVGVDKRQKGMRIDNIPNTGHLTGRYEIDQYGCWWEMVHDEGEDHVWIIGDYPERRVHNDTK